MSRGSLPPLAPGMPFGCVSLRDEEAEKPSVTSPHTSAHDFYCGEWKTVPGHHKHVLSACVFSRKTGGHFALLPHRAGKSLLVRGSILQRQRQQYFGGKYWKDFLNHLVRANTGTSKPLAPRPTSWRIEPGGISPQPGKAPVDLLNSCRRESRSRSRLSSSKRTYAKQFQA